MNNMMKKNYAKKWINLSGSFIIAVLLGASLTMMLSGAIALTPDFSVVLLVSLVSAALLSLSVSSRTGGFAAAFLTGALLLWLIFSKSRASESFSALLDALFALARKEPIELSAHAAAIAGVIGALFTMLIFWLSRMSGGVYPALTLSLVVLMGSWLIKNSLEPRYAVMVVCALVMMFARAADEQVAYLRALPVALIAALLSIWLLPAGNLTWSPLQQAAQKARDLFEDYFLFTDPRTTYSISQDGFQPMGELLGGPAEPSLNEVMEVETGETLLLRGSVKRTYTTYSWTENAVNSRYLFIDPLRKAIRDQIFDAGRAETGAALSGIEAHVTMLSDGLSTLFVPHRLSELSIPLDLVTYFSSGGEVFITRSVQPGDAYSLKADIQTGTSAQLFELAESARAKGDDRYGEIAREYTQLPKGIERGVYDLAARITQNAKTPYEKAAALQDYLMTNYAYSLNVDYPPRNRDFVSYFLLDAKEGYCSYFASAMAVMARLIGLPSRYVEGYLVPERAGGRTTVTGKNAHAWVEIYFEGLGWLSFNPTPGSGDTYQPQRGDEPGDGGQNAEPPENAGAPDAGDETESPEASPSPEPSAALEDETETPGESAEETPEGGEAQSAQSEDDAPQEEPPPEDEPPDEGENEPTGDEQPDQNNAFAFLWLILPLLLIAGAGLFVKRLIDTDPRKISKKGAKSPDRLMIWYRALLLLLEQQGQVPAPDESPLRFAERLREAGLVGDAYVTFARQVFMNRYADKKPDSAIYRQAAVAYEQLAQKLRPTERVRWALIRVLRGLGDIKQVP